MIKCPICKETLQAMEQFFAFGEEENEIEAQIQCYCNHCQEPRTFFAIYTLKEGEWE